MKSRPTNRTRGALACIVATATVFIGAVGHAELDNGAHVDEPARRQAQMRIDAGVPPRAVLISDSAISGIRWYGRQQFLTGTRWEIYLESCRRLVAPSCRGREGYAPRTAAAEINDIRARLGPAGPLDLLVMAVGYNDVDNRFRQDFATVMNTARAAGFRRIVWLTYRTQSTYHLPGTGATSNYLAMNAILADEAASGRWSGFATWDYDATMAGQDQWFSYDGLHVTPEGAERVAQWLSSQLRSPLP